LPADSRKGCPYDMQKSPLTVGACIARPQNSHNTNGDAITA